MKKGLYLLWFAGFALLLVLIAQQGFSQVASALAVAGLGIAAVAAITWCRWSICRPKPGLPCRRSSASGNSCLAFLVWSFGICSKPAALGGVALPRFPEPRADHWEQRCFRRQTRN